jgi:CO dehydrogenase nickel-insertion accessory protein CooC1
LIDYFGGMVFSGGTVTCPVDDPTPLDGARISLETLPKDFCARAEPHVYLLSGGKLGPWGAGAGCDGPITKIARDIRLQIGSEPVVTLIDFKAGFEDTARGVVTAMDWAMVIVDPTQASLALAGHMKSMAEGIRAGQLPATRHLANPELVVLANRLFQETPLRGTLFVLNRIADDSTESFLKRELAAQGIEPIGVIREDPDIRNAGLTGSVIDDSSLRGEVDSLVQTLEAANAESSVPTPV